MRLPHTLPLTTLRRHRKTLYPLHVKLPCNPTLNTFHRTTNYMNPAHYNTRFAVDVWFCLKALKPTKEQVEERQNLHNILQNAVQAHFGRAFEVHYVGLARYATETREEPYEFAIVDTSIENDLVGEEYLENLPPVYDPVYVSQVLQEIGFEGTTQHPSEMKYSVVWPTYNRMHCREILYPVRLRAHHPVAFDLILPGPTVMPLVKLLSAYSTITPEVPQLITLLFLFLKSFDIRGMTPTCIALLVIGFLQETFQFPCLTSSKDKSYGKQYESIRAAGKTYRWALYEHFLHSTQPAPEWCIETVRLDTAFVDLPTPKHNEFHPALLLDKFIQYWGRIAKTSKYLIGSCNGEGKVQRSWSYSPNDILDLTAILKRHSKGTYDQGKQPPMWKIHPMVVPDPFTRTYNHAESVSQATIDYIRNQAAVAQKAIQSGFPLLSIFGPHLEFVPSKLPVPNVNWGSLSSYPTEVLQPPPLYVRKGRSSTVKRVEDVIRRAFDKKYHVEVFGSTAYGVDSSTSDLDLVVIDPDRMNGFPRDVDLKRLPKVYDVRQIGRELEKAGFTNIVSIPKANVPIVKFRDPDTKIDCDLNVNDQLGSINTTMIGHYLDLQPILRPLLKTIKSWAKSLGLNSPSGGGGHVVSFSSYALTLMTIGFFQVKGWLPNLQDSRNLDLNAEGVFWLKTKQGLRQRCDVRYARTGECQPLSLGLEETLLQWFLYWGQEFQYSAELVCIRRGGVVPRKTKFVNAHKPRVNPGAGGPNASEGSDSRPGDEEAEQELSDEDDFLEIWNDHSSDPKDWSQHPFCVADPFIQPKNCCSQINLNVITQFMYGCQSAETFLRTGISLRELIFDPSQVAPEGSRSRHVPKRKEKKTGKKTEKKSAATDSTVRSGMNIEVVSEKSATKVKHNRPPRRTKAAKSAATNGTAISGRSPTAAKSSDGPRRTTFLDQNLVDRAETVAPRTAS